MCHIIITITLYKPVITISISLTFGISNCQFYRYDTCTPISDHSFHEFSLECRNPQFHIFLGHQRAKSESVLNVVMIHLHAKFQAIPSMSSPQNAWKPQLHKGFWPPEIMPILTKIESFLGVVRINLIICSSIPHFRPFLPCILCRMSGNPNFLAIRRLKLDQYKPKSNHFRRWSGYISISGHPFHAFSLECSENSPDGWTLTNTKSPPHPTSSVGTIKLGGDNYAENGWQRKSLNTDTTEW